MSATATPSVARPAVGRPSLPRRRRPAPLRPAGHPDPTRLVRLVVRTYLEVEAGRRPLAQIEPLLAPALAQRLREETRRTSHEGLDVDAIVAVRCDEPAPGVAEAAVVVRRRGRVGAIAVRLAKHGAAWRVEELARPEG